MVKLLLIYNFGFDFFVLVPEEKRLNWKFKGRNIELFMTRFCSNFISHLFIFSTETMVEFVCYILCSTNRLFPWYFHPKISYLSWKIFNFCPCVVLLYLIT
eukprot:UN13098